MNINVNIMFNGEKQSFSTKMRKKAKMSALTGAVEHSTGRSNQHKKARKGNKMHTDWKERNKTVFYLQIT